MLKQSQRNNPNASQTLVPGCDVEPRTWEYAHGPLFAPCQNLENEFYATVLNLDAARSSELESISLHETRIISTMTFQKSF